MLVLLLFLLEWLWWPLLRPPTTAATEFDCQNLFAVVSKLPTLEQRVELPEEVDGKVGLQSVDISEESENAPGEMGDNGDNSESAPSCC